MQSKATTLIETETWLTCNSFTFQSLKISIQHKFQTYAWNSYWNKPWLCFLLTKDRKRGESSTLALPLFNGVMRFRCLPSQPQLVLFYQWNETDLQEHKRRHLVTHMYNCICSGLAWPTFTFTRISKRKNGGHCMIWSSRRLQTFWWHIWSGLALLTTICGRTFCCHRKTVPRLRVQHFCKVNTQTISFA